QNDQNDLKRIDLRQQDGHIHGIPFPDFSPVESRCTENVSCNRRRDSERPLTFRTPGPGRQKESQLGQANIADTTGRKRSAAVAVERRRKTNVPR
ncbi:MAG: hypothetical protein JXL80_10925, partial [Planctomycetes bacterium]|nr:hypothetical protein [Planctomycetota bacterium]